MSAFHVNQKTV